MKIYITFILFLYSNLLASQIMPDKIEIQYANNSENIRISISCTVDSVSYKYSKSLSVIGQEDIDTMFVNEKIFYSMDSISSFSLCQGYINKVSEKSYPVHGNEYLIISLFKCNYKYQSILILDAFDNYRIFFSNDFYHLKNYLLEITK